MITQLIYLSKVTCCNCGVIFGIEQVHNQELITTHKSFYCPSGHSQRYTAKSEAERIKDELTRERQRHDQTKAELSYVERQRRSTKGQLTKIKTRIKNGVCPCCNRTFKNIKDHMEIKHPNYLKD